MANPLRVLPIAISSRVLLFPFNYIDGKLNFDFLYSDDPSLYFSMKEYEERAVSLALDRQKLQALTNKLKSFLAHFVKEVTYKWMLFFLGNCKSRIWRGHISKCGVSIALGRSPNTSK
ncbi:hypothetical protein WN944_016383 [Citrus x changshan-huyou]|uniref:Uncharacterized protein n=1 Tax=Citrus x changshan-huyou TaxID=2935761 RepID=A0AAP0MAU6_9ROSI